MKHGVPVRWLPHDNEFSWQCWNSNERFRLSDVLELIYGPNATIKMLHGKAVSE